MDNPNVKRGTMKGAADATKQPKSSITVAFPFSPVQDVRAQSIVEYRAYWSISRTREIVGVKSIPRVSSFQTCFAIALLLSQELTW